MAIDSFYGNWGGSNFGGKVAQFSVGICRYDASASGGSNLGPTNKKLLETIAERLAVVREENGLSINEAVPADLVRASASCLDPHISPEAALIQVPRIARARGVPEEKIRQLVEQHIEGRQFGFLGEPVTGRWRGQSGDD